MDCLPSRRKGNEMRNAIVLTMLAVLLGACAAQPTATVAPTSTHTSIALTAVQATVTGTPSPSETAAATMTASITPSVTPLPFTFTPIVLFSTATASNTPIGPLDCSLLIQSMANGSQVSAGERFTVGWQLQNTGSATWFPGTTVFTFVGGTKMYLYPEAQLQASVMPEATTTVSVDMKAPKNSTTYTSLWSLRQGTTYFCRVRLTIYVK